MKASGKKDSKGVVVLTIPSFGGLPKNLFFQIFQTSNHLFSKKSLVVSEKTCIFVASNPKFSF